MNEFGLRVADEAVEYLRLIAASMIEQFGVSPREATGRVAEYFAGRQLVSPMQVDLLLHQDEQHWAGQIYYDDHRWRDERTRGEPAPYPRRLH